MDCQETDEHRTPVDQIQLQRQRRRNCVEVATQPTSVHIRDSKNSPATGEILTVSPTTWTAFLGACLAGRS